MVGHYAYGEEIDSAQGVFFVSGRNDQENLDKLLTGDVDYMLGRMSWWRATC